VTNYRNPRNPPPKSRNPHSKKAKSDTGHEIHCNTATANYRNPQNPPPKSRNFYTVHYRTVYR